MPTTSHVEAEPILGEESLDLPADASRPKEGGGSALALFKMGDYDGALKMWQELVKSNAGSAARSNDHGPTISPGQYAQGSAERLGPGDCGCSRRSRGLPAPGRHCHARSRSEQGRLVVSEGRSPDIPIRQERQTEEIAASLALPRHGRPGGSPQRLGGGAEGIRGMVEAGAEQCRGKRANRLLSVPTERRGGCAGKAAGSRQGQPRHVDPRGRSGPVLPGDG